MYNWLDDFWFRWYAQVIVYNGMLKSLRSILTFDVEQHLGRKLTDPEYQYFLQERDRKAAEEAHQAAIRQREQQQADLKKIHDFAWNNP